MTSPNERGTALSLRTGILQELDRWITWLKVDQMFDPLRSEPRFTPWSV
jgi:hypothetical protein